MQDESPKQPKSIDIRSSRCIALALKHQFEGESLTRTVERILERYDVMSEVAQPAESASSVSSSA